MTELARPSASPRRHRARDRLPRLGLELHRDQDHGHGRAAAGRRGFALHASRASCCSRSPPGASGPPVLTRTEIRHVLLMAFLAVLFSNACHVIAMQTVQSNTAALLNATPALWIAWLGTFGTAQAAAHRAQHARAHRSGLAGVLMILAPKGGFQRGRPRLAAPDPARLPVAGRSAPSTTAIRARRTRR